MLHPVSPMSYTSLLVFVSFSVFCFTFNTIQLFCIAQKPKSQICLRGLYNLYPYDIPVPGPHVGSGKSSQKNKMAYDRMHSSTFEKGAWGLDQVQRTLRGSPPTADTTSQTLRTKPHLAYREESPDGGDANWRTAGLRWAERRSTLCLHQDAWCSNTVKVH